LSKRFDAADVLHRALRITSFLCCTLVLASFAVFANDQLAGASAHQASELAGPAIATGAATGVHDHGQPWRFIDDAATRLTGPFSSIVHSHNPWAEHGLAAVFGLLVYGLALGWVARFSAGRA
jgi:hypothetical protein